MYSSTSALLSWYQAKISLICETETVGYPRCILSIVSPIWEPITMVSSVTREFRTRTAPFSNWTRGTVSGKLNHFSSLLSGSYILNDQIKPPPNTFDTTCCKKVFNKQH